MKKQNLIIVCLVLVLLTVIMGYSVFNYSVNSVTKAASVNGINVNFFSIGNIEEVGSKDAKAFITNNKKNVFINVPFLLYKGAYVKIPITIKNEGLVPVKLDFIKEHELSASSAVTINYEGIGATDALLSPGQITVLIVRIKWENKEISTYEKSVFKIQLNYIQA